MTQETETAECEDCNRRSGGGQKAAAGESGHYDRQGTTRLHAPFVDDAFNDAVAKKASIQAAVISV